MPKPKPTKPDRGNQRLRTRKDLLAAATRLLKEGRSPSMEDVAEAALVSRATAYRYFPSIEALLVEAPLDGSAPTAKEIFANDKSSDPEARVDKAERSLHEMIYRNEAQLRLMLAASLGRLSAEGGVPRRQNRRTELIEAALAPARDQFSDAVYQKLRAALALIFGTESMIVFKDVLEMDEKTARSIKSWAVRALVRAARDDSSAPD